ncbi:hypothetical protein CRENBAI_002345 [Crenichthys baileyi]|uniref:Uncharacterized protein n=1 Tax=Crenichthys baileyi TaxID=28760 RepID=A0AAV9R930_9TELE
MFFFFARLKPTIPSRNKSSSDFVYSGTVGWVSELAQKSVCVREVPLGPLQVYEDNRPSNMFHLFELNLDESDGAAESQRSARLPEPLKKNRPTASFIIHHA